MVGTKRVVAFLFIFGLGISACLPALPQANETPTPILEADLQSTAAVISQQTLLALPTLTAPPSATVVVVTPTATEVSVTPTETVNPVLLTLTATLLAGTGAAETVTVPATNGTPAASNQTATAGTPQPLFYGTLPPNLPSGTINLFNKAHVDVYISLRCVTKDGYVTIIEYPVKKNFDISAPAGNYTYVAWVGGRQFEGSFGLSKDGYIIITFFKNRITVKKD